MCIRDRVRERADLSSVKARTMLELSKAMIMVKYQLAREQVGRGLADQLVALIDNILNELKAKKKPEEVHEVLERARTLLDSIATIVYTYGKRA